MFFLLILLAGDVAINPGPSFSRNSVIKGMALKKFTEILSPIKQFVISSAFKTLFTMKTLEYVLTKHGLPMK